MRTHHWPAFCVIRTLIPTVFLSVFLICCGDLIFSGSIFSGSTESTGQTYNQYVADKGDAWFDPKGASNISQRTSSTRDGHDAWWRFTISEPDFLSIVTQVAKDQNGPAQIQLVLNYFPNGYLPSRWNAESEVPGWWTIDRGNNPQSIHWCFNAGGGERHDGWFFVYNPDLETAWCWHWSHQWSSNECP